MNKVYGSFDDFKNEFFFPHHEHIRYKQCKFRKSENRLLEIIKISPQQEINSWKPYQKLDL